MHLWKVSPPGNVKKAEHRLRLCMAASIETCHRPQQWADRTLRDLASVLLLEALTRVMVFMCEKHFLTQRQEPNATWRHVTQHDGS